MHKNSWRGCVLPRQPDIRAAFIAAAAKPKGISAHTTNSAVAGEDWHFARRCFSWLERYQPDFADKTTKKRT
jgi:hypothetical protein